MSTDALSTRRTTTAVTAKSRREDPTLDGLMRFGAVCGVIFGLSLGVPGVIEAFTGETTVTSFIVGLCVAAFAVPALVAFHLHQADVAGRFGGRSSVLGWSSSSGPSCSESRCCARACCPGSRPWGTRPR